MRERIKEFVISMLGSDNGKEEDTYVSLRTAKHILIDHLDHDY